MQSGKEVHQVGMWQLRSLRFQGTMVSGIDQSRTTTRRYRLTKALGQTWIMFEIRDSIIVETLILVEMVRCFFRLERGF